MSSCDTFSALKKNLQQLNPQLILIDYELPGFIGYQSIQELLAISKQIKIVLFGPNLSDETEWDFFKAGIKGYCPDKASAEQINKVINAILQGELWIRRTLTHRILDELIKTTHEKKRIKQSIQDAIASLTHRENEIALLVAQGESNKNIAHQLAITERTVKAHLTEIFKKMRVTDRVKVALIIKDVIQSR
ncbi:MAG: response regulator transcription factor [Nitrosomonas sp.]|nr:response regulator transcription factor [Nitrosomonas sp.]